MAGALDDDTLFDYLKEQTQEDLLSLLALCAASSLDVVSDRETNQCGRSLAIALDLDMAQFWTATAVDYFSHVSKAKTLEAVASFAPDRVKGLEKLKKGDLVAVAEQLAAGTRWLPSMLRRPE